jgi:hypothetical protein
MPSSVWCWDYLYMAKTSIADCVFMEFQDMHDFIHYTVEQIQSSWNSCCHPGPTPSSHWVLWEHQEVWVAPRFWSFTLGSAHSLSGWANILGIISQFQWKSGTEPSPFHIHADQWWPRLEEALSSNVGTESCCRPLLSLSLDHLKFIGALCRSKFFNGWGWLVCQGQCL